MWHFAADADFDENELDDVRTLESQLSSVANKFIAARNYRPHRATRSNFDCGPLLASRPVSVDSGLTKEAPAHD